MRDILTIYSPNFSTKRRNLKKIKFIIIHYTGMKSEIEAINRLIDDKSKVSCHYFIKKNGQLILMVPDQYVAWHAGKSRWKSFNFLNNYSIGIEVQNPGHDNNYQNFKSSQIRTLTRLCRNLRKKYKIKKINILGHSDISYDRKKDPGEKFPWKTFAKRGLSIWHDINKNELKQYRNVAISLKEKKIFFNNLVKFGYSHIKKKKYNKKLIVAFQRRFRSQLINGIIDQECLKISVKISNFNS
tara:strand:- start:172 stop:897 length:726 start_codon:yes stop_codon:yes gene_type:complete